MAGFHTHFELGVKYSAAGRHDLAEVEFGRVLIESPQDALVALLRGVARFELRKWAAAEADFSAFLKLNKSSDPVVLALRAVARLGRRRFVGAAADLAKAAALAIAERIHSLAIGTISRPR